MNENMTLLGGEDDPGTMMGAGGFGGYGGAGVIDPETRRRLMLQVGLPAMGAQLGGALLAAAQGGQHPSQRAHWMAQAGQAPAVGMAAAAQGQRLAMQEQQAQAMAQYRQAQMRQLERQNARDDALSRMFLGGGGGGGGTPRLGGAIPQPGAGGASGDLYLPEGSDDLMPLATVLRRGEGGASAQGATNSGGFSGRWQFGAPRLAELGFYAPGEGEDLRNWSGGGGTQAGSRQWTGQITIPGFGTMTRQEFLANPRAQDAAFAAHMRQIDGIIDQTPQAQQMDRNGLRAVAHLGGPNGMVRFIQTGGQYNPADGNGVRLSDYYQRYSGLPARAQTQQGATVPASAPLTPPQATLVQNTPQALLDRLDPQTRAAMAANPRAAAQTLVNESVRAAAQQETWRPLSRQETAQQGLPADRNWQVNQRTGRIEEVGTQGRTTATERVAQGMTEEAMRRYRTAAEASDAERTQFLPVLQQFRSLSGTLPEGGPLTEHLLPLRNAMAQLGMLTPEAAQNANTATVMQALTTRMAPLIRQAGSGTMSDRDVALFLQSIPSISQTPHGREAVAALLERAIEHRSARVSLMEQYISERGNLVGFEEYARPRLPSLSVPRARSFSDLEQQAEGSLVIVDNATIRTALGIPGSGPAMYVVRRRPEQ